MSDVSLFYSVGWVQGAQGIKGENFLRFYTKNPEWLAEIDELRLVKVTDDCRERLKKVTSKKDVRENEITDIQIHEVQKIKPHKNGYIVKLKNVKDRNQAELLKGRIIQINEQFLVETSNEDEFYFKEIEGFEVINNGVMSCGIIVGHYHNGAHDIIQLTNNFSGKEIPFVDHFIDSIDFESKKIFMKLPEGLLEL